MYVAVAAMATVQCIMVVTIPAWAAKEEGVSSEV